MSQKISDMEVQVGPKTTIQSYQIWGGDKSNLKNTNKKDNRNNGPL